MIRITSDPSKSISRVVRTGTETQWKLNWTSDGFDLFCVLASNRADDIDLSGLMSDQLINDLNQDSLELPENTTVKYGSIRVRIVTFTQLKKSGGVDLDGEPGYYAVYGASHDGSDLQIFVDDNSSAKSHIIRILRDIEIIDEPVKEQQGLFKKTSVYSGYHRITVKGEQRGLAGGVLNYTIGGFTYPFPDSVVERGGGFFVKMNESDDILISSENQGLNINHRKILHN